MKREQITMYTTEAYKKRIQKCIEFEGRGQSDTGKLNELVAKFVEQVEAAMEWQGQQNNRRTVTGSGMSQKER